MPYINYNDLPHHHSLHPRQLTPTAYYHSVSLHMIHHPQEETVIIAETYNYRPNYSHLNPQPTYQENFVLQEQMGRVESRLQEETVIIGETYNYRPNYSHLNTQPTYQENFVLQEQMGRVDSRLQEETVPTGVAFDYWPNHSRSYHQPTYEENLELEEQMGRVGSRLSEETIMGHLKIRDVDATTIRMNEEPDICVICQSEYEKDELIGGLHCRHEYHVNCIKKWLQQNNSCPICKAAAV